MTPFLYETAYSIIKDNKNNLDNLCLIFPNKRTVFWFRKYYAQILNKASKPAKMTEIGRFIRELTGYGDEDKLSLIFDLYRVFKSFNDTEKYTFDNFYKLGEIIISDFNEIDAWLVNPAQIYRNIKDLKEIDSQFRYFTDEQKELIKNFWANYLDEKSSEEKQMFLNLWNLLPAVYDKFTQELKEKKFGYNGLIYRIVWEMIGADEINTDKYEKYIFIGFNALNKAELELFKYFNKKGIAEFYWDIDRYYFEDNKQEAGDFLRKNIKDLELQLSCLPDNFKGNKKIKIFGVSSKMGQAKLLSSLLSNKNADYEKNTAIITADEDFLFPVLSSIPEHIQKINVTMGFSFKLTPLYNFIYRYIQVRLSAEKNKNFYFKTALNILKHPYIIEYNSELCSEISKQINESKLIFISSGFFIKKQDKLLNIIFKKTDNKDNTDALLSDLLNILFVFFDKNSGNNLKNEYIFRAYKKIKRFREILRENSEKVSLKLASDLLLQLLKSDTIPFEGQTDEGLQIMGLMESRNLDFKNVIILGVNEGNLPKISKSPSFISQSLRYAFGLPLIKYQDAVFAYFFYRLLQRAEDITLIYNDVTDDKTPGEMSRFITQLLYETNLDIYHRHLNEDLFLPAKEKIIVKKDDKLKLRLRELFISGNKKTRSLSASALNTYIDCSLKFYFRYVAGLKEKEKIEDELTAAEFGSVLHKALENIYSDIVSESDSKIITKNKITPKISQAENYVSQALKHNYKNPEYKPEGIQIIIKNVITNYVKYVLYYDIRQTPFEIVSLERDKEYECEFKIKTDKGTEIVKLSGIIDRIDKKNDILRIIDYKTGKTYDKLFSLDSLFDSENKYRNRHVFQALFYTLILKEIPEYSDKKIKPSLFYVRSMNKKDYSEMPPVIVNEDFKNKIIDENITEIIVPLFKESLRNLTEEIFSDEFSFSQTENKEKCEYCEFKGICG